MRPRAVAWFGAGIVVGFFLFYSLAWRTGALAEGHWLTRRTAEVPGRSAAATSAPAAPPAAYPAPPRAKASPSPSPTGTTPAASTPAPTPLP